VPVGTDSVRAVPSPAFSCHPGASRRQIRWDELESLGCRRGAQSAVEGRECCAALVGQAHSQGAGELDCIIGAQAMRGAEPGSTVKEAARGNDGHEPRRLGAGPEIISLEIGSEQSRVVGGQLTHALLAL
jgi:hypothetical protein